LGERIQAHMQILWQQRGKHLPCWVNVWSLGPILFVVVTLPASFKSGKNGDFCGTAEIVGIGFSFAVGMSALDTQ
jgi:hypothetical protein